MARKSNFVDKDYCMSVHKTQDLHMQRIDDKLETLVNQMSEMGSAQKELLKCVQGIPLLEMSVSDNKKEIEKHEKSHETEFTKNLGIIAVVTTIISAIVGFVIKVFTK